MKICLFSSYYEHLIVPNYVIYYIRKLEPYFDKIYLITNRRIITNIDSLDGLNVDVILVENIGYDFGMYYHFLSQNLNMTYKIEHLALINDSCICFKDLNHVFEIILTSKSDYCGLTDSIESTYHVQSFFLYFKNKSIIKDLINYILNNGVVTNYSKVISTYETGLTEYFKRLNYSIDSVYSYMSFLDYDKKNIVLYFAKELISIGCPLIKKKVLLKMFTNIETYYLSKNGFNFSINYVDFIKKYGIPQEINFLLSGLHEFNLGSEQIE